MYIFFILFVFSFSLYPSFSYYPSTFFSPLLERKKLVNQNFHQPSSSSLLVSSNYVPLSNISVQEKLKSLSFNKFFNQNSILEQFIKLGKEKFDRNSLNQTKIEELKDKKFQRVPGCVSDLFLKLERINMEERNIPSPISSSIKLIAYSDSFFGSGAIEFFKELFSSLTKEEFLSITPSLLFNSFSFNSFTNSNRILGIENFLLLLQDLIRNDENILVYEGKDRKEKLINIQDKNEEIAVLISGGVDSAVSLSLLKQLNRTIRAYYIKAWLPSSLALSSLEECPHTEDIKIITKICQNLSIPLEILPFQGEYYDEILKNYLYPSLISGFTPNPDVLCNEKIKFGALWKWISEKHKYVASGHYASIKRVPYKNKENGKLKKIYEKAILVRCKDSFKDQTYFLSRLSQNQLKKVIFPLEFYTKKQIRLIAKIFNLINYSRKDSQGLCFLGKVSYTNFLKLFFTSEKNLFYSDLPGLTPNSTMPLSPIGLRPGPILDYSTKQPIGQHNGLAYFTLGQRKGLGGSISQNMISKGPWMTVVKKIYPNLDGFHKMRNITNSLLSNGSSTLIQNEYENFQPILYVSNKFDQVNFPRRCFLSNDIRWISIADDEIIDSNNFLWKNIKKYELNSIEKVEKKMILSIVKQQINQCIFLLSSYKIDSPSSSIPLQSLSKRIKKLFKLYLLLSSNSFLFEKKIFFHSIPLHIQVRHGEKVEKGKLLWPNEGNKQNSTISLPSSAYVILDKPEHSLTPGQFSTFYYKNKLCLGSGEIHLAGIDPM